MSCSTTVVKSSDGATVSTITSCAGHMSSWGVAFWICYSILSLILLIWFIAAWVSLP